MDFFGAQDQARGKTKQLVALYFLAIIAIIAAIYLVFVFAGFGTDFVEQQSPGSYSTASQQSTFSASDLFDPGLLAMVAGGVVLIVGGASLFKINALGGSGSKVAESVGGRQIDMSTTDPHERKFLNVVEEMSIASGTPMPDVFILDNERAINAFAAGTDINNAAIAVTKGAIEQLSRDELQGVVAHEFSHIFSGDMRLNIRLMGPLFGLLVIAFLGRMFLYSGGGRSRGKNQGSLVLVGLAIMVIGYVGVIFGRLIQAAISRQREYLADASAVQFTRNPEGIANALRRLGYDPSGSKIQHAHAEDTAHMFFAKALGSSFATHPPLPKRIKAILPGWDGSFLPPHKSASPEEPSSASPSSKKKPSGFGDMMTAATAVAAVGALGENHLREGIEQRIRIRRCLGDIALDDTTEARTIFTALILAKEADSRIAQLSILDASSEPFAGKVKSRYDEIENLSASDRFALMELSCPGIRKLAPKDRKAFTDVLQSLAEEDGQISLREALVLEVIHRQASGKGSQGKKSPQRLEKSIDKHADPASRLLYLVASLGSENSSDAQEAFRDAVAKQPDLKGKLTPPESTPEVAEINDILNALDRISFGLRKQILAAAADMVLRDDVTSDREWTFLRLVSLTLGAPMPAIQASATSDQL